MFDVSSVFVMSSAVLFSEVLSFSAVSSDSAVMFSDVPSDSVSLLSDFPSDPVSSLSDFPSDPVSLLSDVSFDPAALLSVVSSDISSFSTDSASSSDPSFSSVTVYMLSSLLATPYGSSFQLIEKFSYTRVSNVAGALFTYMSSSGSNATSINSATCSTV